MIWQGWLFLGLIAFAATYVTLTTNEDDVAIMFGLVGLLTWGLWSFQSLSVVVWPDGSSSAEIYSYPMFSMWGVAMAVTCLYVVLNGPIALVDQRRNDLTDDPQ